MMKTFDGNSGIIFLCAKLYIGYQFTTVLWFIFRTCTVAKIGETQALG